MLLKNDVIWVSVGWTASECSVSTHWYNNIEFDISIIEIAFRGKYQRH